MTSPSLFSSTTEAHPRDDVAVESLNLELRALEIVESMRPSPLRDYDQIPMRSHDLLQQAKFVAPRLANASVAFVGDSDGTSVLLALLTATGLPCPTRMLVLDFDERLLMAMQAVAERYGFADRLHVRLYNVFDPVPAELVHQYDWFYANPPYGCRNSGESARLFITRGCELTRADRGHGCIILPYARDEKRAWTRGAMLATQAFLTRYGWLLSRVDPDAHKYHLDDDRDLSSSRLLVEHIDRGHAGDRMPYGGRAVGAGEIEHFYGREVHPPYPRYIRPDGHEDFNWPQATGLR